MLINQLHFLPITLQYTTALLNAFIIADDNSSQSLSNTIGLFCASSISFNCSSVGYCPFSIRNVLIIIKAPFLICCEHLFKPQVIIVNADQVLYNLYPYICFCRSSNISAIRLCIHIFLISALPFKLRQVAHRPQPPLSQGSDMYFLKKLTSINRS